MSVALLPLFGPLPDGNGPAGTLLVRFVLAGSVAFLVGWDANRRSDDPRAWPAATRLVGLGGVGGAMASVPSTPSPAATTRRRAWRSGTAGASSPTRLPDRPAGR